MAGILDFLQSPETQLGIGLLAAGGPSTTPMNVGQRVQLAMQGMNAQQQNALKMKLLQSQVDENASQNALRQGQMARQARQDAYFLGGAMPSAASTQEVGGVVAPPGVPAIGVASSAGAVLKAAAGKPADAPPPPQGKFAEWSKQYNIPVDALISDYFSNGGKGIAEMIYKRGTPDMQVSNGFAYDKNKLAGGFMPQINTSSTGQTSMILPSGPGGAPVVSAPEGAVNTYAAYQGAQAAFKPIKVFNPVTQREEYTSEGAVVSPMAGARGNVQSSGYAGGDRNGANAESIRMIQSELAKPGNSPADIAAMQREIQRLQMQSGSAPQSGNFAAGPSTTEAATAKANERFQTGVADAAAKNVETSQAQAQSAAATLQNVAQIRSGIDKAILGPGANARVTVSQLGQMLGITGKDEADVLASTRNVMQGLARQELSAAGQMKGQGQITESERAILRKAEAGEINSFTKGELQTLVGALEKTASYRLQAHERLIGQVKSGASPTDLMQVQKPAAPAPVATMRFNPATGKIEQVK